MRRRVGRSLSNFTHPHTHTPHGLCWWLSVQRGHCRQVVEDEEASEWVSSLLLDVYSELNHGNVFALCVGVPVCVCVCLCICWYSAKDSRTGNIETHTHYIHRRKQTDRRKLLTIQLSFLSPHSLWTKAPLGAAPLYSYHPEELKNLMATTPSLNLLRTNKQPLNSKLVAYVRFFNQTLCLTISLSQTHPLNSSNCYCISYHTTTKNWMWGHSSSLGVLCMNMFSIFNFVLFIHETVALEIF